MVLAGLHPTGPSWCLHTGWAGFLRRARAWSPLASWSAWHSLPSGGSVLVLNPVPASTVGRGSELLPGEAGAVSLQREAFLRWSACCRRALPCTSDRRTEGCPLGPPRYLNHPHANGAAQTPPPSPEGQMSSSTAPLCSLRRYHLSLSGRGRALTLASTGHG